MQMITRGTQRNVYFAVGVLAIVYGFIFAPVAVRAATCLESYKARLEQCILNNEGCISGCVDPYGNYSDEYDDDWEVYDRCLFACSESDDVCTGAAYDIYNPCRDDGTGEDGCITGEVAANGTCVPSTPMTQSDGGRTQNSGTGASSTAAQEAACSVAYSTCAGSCPVSEETVTEDISDPFECFDRANAAYGAVYEAIFDACYDKKHTCESNIINREDGSGGHPCWGLVMSPCFDEMYDTCTLPYDACLQPAQDAGDAERVRCEAENTVTHTLWTGEADAACVSACSQTKSNCLANISPSSAVLNDADPEIDDASDDHAIDDDSVSFDADASDEYADDAPYADVLENASPALTEAQKLLEEIMRSNDPRWEEKSEFAEQYDAALDREIEALSMNPEDAAELKELMEAFRAVPESARDFASLAQDLQDFKETVAMAGASTYGEHTKIGFLSDAVDALIAYNEARAEGASVADAETKAMLDTHGASVVTLIPFLNVLDFVATFPDTIMQLAGLPETHWLRQGLTVGMAKASPSGVIQETTTLMIQEDWDDIWNVLVYAAYRIENAEGIYHTTGEAVYFGAAAIGAFAVGTAQVLSDGLDVVMNVSGVSYDYVASWFID